MKIYIIIYDGMVSTEGYETEDKAFGHLEKQGYKQVMGWLFKNGKHTAMIKDIKII